MNYTDFNRGKIQYRERRKQILDFSNLRFGNITPTDCDGLIEYRGKAYILFEVKHRDTDVPKGQLTALVRSVDDFQRAHKEALLILATHQVDDPALDIDAADCSVRFFYHSGSWFKGNGSLKSLIEKFIEYVNGSNFDEQSYFDGQFDPRPRT